MKIKNLQKKKRAGFTLVEMVLVVTILGTLSGIGFMKFGNIQETSRKNADYVAAANLATATNLYITEHASNVEFSASEQGKIISISTLKDKKYINYEPKPQSVEGSFIIEVLNNGEIQVGSNGKTFYPKPEETKDKQSPLDDTK